MVVGYSVVYTTIVLAAVEGPNDNVNVTLMIVVATANLMIATITKPVDVM
jgi:hypothetical protein